VRNYDSWLEEPYMRAYAEQDADDQPEPEPDEVPVARFGRLGVYEEPEAPVTWCVVGDVGRYGDSAHLYVGRYGLGLDEATSLARALAPLVDAFALLNRYEAWAALGRYHRWAGAEGLSPAWHDREAERCEAWSVPVVTP
jgi:hypothetical protein